ncbi:dmX-like protein 2 isoform X2 [Ostrea edulis]|uniref:dmX-like protein 2 isoform X2 n=1 Tax=Ostrea edulis TaxID=37623 RepID=UPI0024AEB1DD|nr:dmX-like protein 2 isoform X2 [Ostrea edulis]
MNRHQVLTGACNAGDQCYAVGSVEGIHFTAYAAGCDIVVLASDFQRVQIIPGVTHGNVKVNCIDCSTDSGKIAASYQNEVYIFEPTPLRHHESTHKLDYRWYQTAKFEADCYINCLSWNIEGSRLLTGGESIQIWAFTQEHHDESGGGSKSVHFDVGGMDDDHKHDKEEGEPFNPIEEILTVWDCVWRCRPATAVYHLRYSWDGLLFASAGKNDRLVKIWYEDRKNQLPLMRADSLVSPKKDEQHYSYIYIAHPRAVTGFSWRKTSKYMPRGAVANMLVTSCLDNVCRLWVETILPDDGLVDLEQFDPNASVDPKFHTHRHKKRFLQRLKTIRHAIHKRRKHNKMGPETVMSMANFNSVQSVHDFHKYAIHHNGMATVLHFHLAASINPETDVPLLPVIGSKGDQQFNFQLHWLNNKELQFTMEAEIILQDMHKGVLNVDSHGDEHGNHEASDSDHEDHHLDDIEKSGHQPPKKKKSKLFKRKNRHSHHGKSSKDMFGSYVESQASVTSSDPSDHNSEGTGSAGFPEDSVIDTLDRKIEVLLRDWHQHADMMFSIHPVDGSFLVWLVDWLDEYNPYCFRQAQVCFSSRLPHAFPVPDARTMASHLWMYCNYSKMDIKSAMRLSESSNSVENSKIQYQPAPATGKNSPGQNDNMLIPNVLLISKHINGSLNQWQISFSDQSKFSTVVSVAHATRACGHRFRTNSATCHPVLPLLLSTSHHNLPKELNSQSMNYFDGQKMQRSSSKESEEDMKHGVGGVEFCSELILWRVDPVGPLSKSGGIVELARINSPELAAFSDVAWVPTLLPSSTLGSYSNSPSALFVASDGNCLRMFQAVIDARTLLLEVGAQKRETAMSFSSNTSSGYSFEPQKPPGELFNIVSLQSSARPGCIIELEPIADAAQSWQQTQLLHVFQEQLITGRSSTSSSSMEAIVDLRTSGSFCEHFYLVVLEKTKNSRSVLHMWKITISSKCGEQSEESGDGNRNCSTGMSAEEIPSENSTPEHMIPKPTTVVKVVFSTTKVCTQALPLPEGVEVQSANVSAGHLSSASIYPACLAPYLLVTACSDGEVRFWNCNLSSVFEVSGNSMPPAMSYSTTSFEIAVEEDHGMRKPSTTVFTKSEAMETSYRWQEWSMMNSSKATSSISITGHPITVSCAYSGRLAVAYRLVGPKSLPSNPKGKFLNFWVAIYECESTGGSEWVLEDTIELKNVTIPDPKAEIDMECIFSPAGIKSPRLTEESETPKGMSPSASLVNISKTVSIPSLSTICSVRKSIAEHGNMAGILHQKHLVQLDWVSTEDGSHILTIGVGQKILMYAQVSDDIINASKQGKENSEDKSKSKHGGGQNLSRGTLNLHLGEGKAEAPKSRGRLQKAKSVMIMDDSPEDIRWMLLRSVELCTADGLPPLPMHISWVRAGILVVGMDNEMHVYSQWRSTHCNTDHGSTEDSKCLQNPQSSCFNIETLASMKSTTSFKPSYSLPNFKHLNTMSKKSSEVNGMKSNLNKTKSDSLTSLTAIHDFGLFEAVREANPCLPQYHPKEMMELLNFGKVRRVKAILAHLVRCICNGEIPAINISEEMDTDDLKWNHGRSRTLSVSGASPKSPNEVPLLHEEPQLEYKEISFIPPLPMYALLAADEQVTVARNDHMTSTAPGTATANQDYSDLFSSGVAMEEELDTNVLGTSADSNMSGRGRVQSTSGSSPSHPNEFTPNHSRILMKHLTHTQLPGLTSVDQMYLLAIADTVANNKIDFTDKFEVEKTGAGSTGDMLKESTETIDDCGLRFLLAMKNHIYLVRTLQPRQRAALQKVGLKSFNLVWAFHSESTEELLSHIPSMQKGEPTWEELRQFGAGWWVNNINILKRTIEKVAKSAFQRRKDPMDAALFYLAMKRKNVLWGLYRSIDNKRMMDFFKNDFSVERWRKAALKNAFDLLGKQRFDHAAAFFLLAGSLHDAVEVCMNNLKDIQLALVVCRLFDGETMMPESAKQVLHKHILGYEEQDSKTASLTSNLTSDPFLRSMAWWNFKEYRKSLKTLLLSNSMKTKLSLDDQDLGGRSAIPSVFNFYNYLRTHPLILRHKITSAAPLAQRKGVIPGFTRQQTIIEEQDSLMFIDKVTPMERRLFFRTAHTHYTNGCPLLALEVLSKLPNIISEEDIESDNEEKSESVKPLSQNISTGTLVAEDRIKNKDSSAEYDWGSPSVNGMVNGETADAFDWSKPLTNGNKDTSNTLDWGAQVSRFDLEEEPKFTLSSGESDLESETESHGDEVPSKPTQKGKLQKIPNIVVDDALPNGSAEMTPDQKSSHRNQIDIFAQQYKFIACLKVLMEEMRTLATGFEVDGGQLRFQLYIWLEREVEVLQYLCNYGEGVEIPIDNQQEQNFTTFEDGIDPASYLELSAESNASIPESTLEESSSLLDVSQKKFNRSMSMRSDASGASIKPTLHEVILAEKMDFEAKLERMSRRKQWLKMHHQLLRTLASYCMLQGSGGGGLASVQMELLLLLQFSFVWEVQQEKPQQQLLSPLPFPTTLPLLSASIASSKTVVADPIKHIQCVTQDLLHSVIEMTVPPGIGSSMNTVGTMRDLSFALSACVYQCLCDCDSFVVSLNETSDAFLEGFTSHNFTSAQAGHLMAGVQRYRRKSSVGDEINTSPASWPGVQGLRAMLAREKDDDAPKLHILLCETLVAVYISLLVTAMATYDCNMLYRLIAHRFVQQMWCALFGGGAKTILKVSDPPVPMRSTDEVDKQRLRLVKKVMGGGKGGGATSLAKEKPVKETFIPPELSMVTFFMTKPFANPAEGTFVYDSEDSLSSDEDSDDDSEYESKPSSLAMSAVQQHTDPTSYSWSLLRYSLIKLVLHNLNTFLPHVGIDLPELPVCSPLMHAVLKTLEQWMHILQGKLELFSGPPDDFIANLHIDVIPGKPHSKFRALLNPSNSPFIDAHSTLPIKRLWFYLIKQEPLKEVFIRYIFRKKVNQSEETTSQSESENSMKLKEPMKIIHKEQDIITAFALNQIDSEYSSYEQLSKFLNANANLLALSTQKDIIELDIGPVLAPPTWLEDENEMDIEYIKNPAPAAHESDFFVVQTPSDTQTSPYSSAATSPQSSSQGHWATGRSTTVILKRPVAGVRRIGPHPNLPHYLTGSADGSVRLYEWGHMQPLAMLRQPGAFPKVTKVLFSAQGNKCCVSDTEGDVCLWQVGLGSNFTKPIMSLRCHNKTTSDFSFIGSSSLIATAGHSSESRNVCLWDTLLPPRSACVHSFICHEHGCPAIVYAPHHQLLISGGRKGEVCIFDIRQRQLRHTFQAHDVPIRCLAMDPEEEYFVTGSSEGDIKVWGLDVHQLVVSFPGEHSKSTFFKNIGSTSGVTQVAIGPEHNLFSCGIDGSMKFRSLPERESMVRYWTA